MRILTPILIAIGLLYALCQASWHWYLGSLYADKPHAVAFCTVWWIVFLVMVAVSLAAMVLYAVELYRRRESPRSGTYALAYIVACVLLHGAGFLWIKFQISA